MYKTVIYDLNKYEINERNGTYGGRAGEKEGITIDGDYWIVKYPKSTKGMEGNLASYMTAPLSEYIGSHIYQILGIDTHETILGIRNDKLVVACKDFCKTEGSLREIRTLKNVYNKELSEKLEESSSSTSSPHSVDINELLTHFEYNPVLKAVPDIKERFWDSFVVDILINNNDRNNGNWGVLYENGQYRLAPVFDNGASFSNKMSETKINELLNNNSKFKASVLNTTTIFSINDKLIHARDILELDFEGLSDAVQRIVPVIRERMNDIKSFISEIPSKHNDIAVCFDVRKEFYIKSMEKRLENFLLPALEMAKNKKGMRESGISSKIAEHTLSDSKESVKKKKPKGR